MIVDTSVSANAKMTMLPMGSVRTTGDSAFGRLYQKAISDTIPSMGHLMFDPQVAHAYDNFLVASQSQDGEYVGPPFMDGDFYKWIESAVVMNAVHGDDALAEMIEKAATAIADAQESDGYVHTMTRIAQQKGAEVERLENRMNFELYNLGHLMTMACVHHRITGSDEYLATARKAADFLIGLAETDPDIVADNNICPSHYMGVVELFRTTGDERYRQLAARLLELHGGKGLDGSDDNQDVLAVRDQRSAVGHSVRANYLYAGMADYALEADDPELVAALDSIWNDLMDTKLYITGGCGALYDGASPDGGQNYWAVTRTHQAYGRPYQLPQTTAYNESCASLGLVMWAWRMLALTGDGKYADEIERVMYNALPAMIGADGISYFYTNPLRQVRGLPYPLRRSGDPVDAPPTPSHDRPRQEFMKGCFCCPPNIARFIVELPFYAYAHKDDQLWIHQYLEGTADATLGGTHVAIEQKTVYPADGEVQVRITADEPVRATVRLRIPQWATGHSVSVNGEVVSGDVDKGYVTIEREWSDDTIALSIEIVPQLIAAHHFLEEATGQVCVLRGPVVYCVEEADLPSGAGVESIALSAQPRWTETAGTGIFEGHVLLTAENGKKLVKQVADGGLYARFDPTPPETVPFQLVPYALWNNRGSGEMSVWMSVHAGADA